MFWLFMEAAAVAPAFMPKQLSPLKRNPVMRITSSFYIITAIKHIQFPYSI
jgi:hypothetical protein